MRPTMKPAILTLAAAFGAGALVPPAAQAARASDIIQTAIRFSGDPARAFAQALQLPLDAPASVVFLVGRLPEQKPVQTTVAWDPARGELRIAGFLRDMTTGWPVRPGPVCELPSPSFAANEIDGMPGWKPVWVALQRIAPVPGKPRSSTRARWTSR